LPAATSLAEIFAIGCEELDQSEAAQLEIALGAKLMDLASYRPYELDLRDCRFIQSSMRKHARRLRRDNRAVLARSCSGTAARLWQRGLYRQAAALVSPSQYPATACRIALRTIASPMARERLRRRIGRRTNMLLK
jgi:hypothetical protein